MTHVMTKKLYLCPCSIYPCIFNCSIVWFCSSPFSLQGKHRIAEDRVVDWIFSSKLPHRKSHRPTPYSQQQKRVEGLPPFSRPACYAALKRVLKQRGVHWSLRIRMAIPSIVGDTKSSRNSYTLLPQPYFNHRSISRRFLLSMSEPPRHQSYDWLNANYMDTCLDPQLLSAGMDLDRWVFFLLLANKEGVVPPRGCLLMP